MIIISLHPLYLLFIVWNLGEFLSWNFLNVWGFNVLIPPSPLFLLGAAHAKLVAQKAKGMPRIAISLSKLVDTAATEAMANLSLALYTTFTNVHNLLKAGLYPDP